MLNERHYIDCSNACSICEFINYMDFLELAHFIIFLWWNLNFNTQKERLMLKLDSSKLLAMYNNKTIDHGVLATIGINIKEQCKGIAYLLTSFWIFV